MTALARVLRRGNPGHAGRHHLHRSRLSASESALPLRRRLALLLGLLPLATGLLLGGAAAERAPAVYRMSAADAAQVGQAITIARHDDLAAGLAEVRVPSAVAATRAGGADQLLAVAAQADMAAVAEQIGPETTALIVARSDGSQLQVELPGLIAAAFAPDGEWLAAVDGTGALWRVAATDGAARRITTGPFIGQPVVNPDGSILALRVPSVEAPYQSRLVRVAQDGGAVALTDEALVYGAQPLADGSLAVVAHRPAGTFVRRLAGTRAVTLAELGQDAVNVAVDPSAGAIAWERDGEVFVQRLAGGSAQRIAAGTNPRFSPDGRALLVDLPGGTQLREPDGTLLATFSAQLGFAACIQGCAP